MALTVPDPATLYAFWGDEADTSNITRTTFWLQAATDLVWYNTQLDADPADLRQLRFVQYGIMDMAIYLMAGREDISEEYSTFSGETIGSYSYTKNFRKIAGQGGNTGIYFYDLLVNAFLFGMWAKCALGGGENVFTRSLDAYDPTERLLHPARAFNSGISHDGGNLSDFNDVLTAPVANDFPFFGGD